MYRSVINRRATICHIPKQIFSPYTSLYIVVGQTYFGQIETVLLAHRSYSDRVSDGRRRMSGETTACSQNTDH